MMMDETTALTIAIATASLIVIVVLTISMRRVGEHIVAEVGRRMDETSRRQERVGDQVTGQLSRTAEAYGRLEGKVQGFIMGRDATAAGAAPEQPKPAAAGSEPAGEGRTSS